jgi:hypothetical protein
MTEPRNATYAHQDLVKDMNDLRSSCGQPSLREIQRESAKVASFYLGQGYKDAAELSLTALSDTLKGNRKKPPRWSWLVVYVVTCRTIARRSPGLRDELSTEEVLADWNERFTAAVRAAEEEPPAEPPAPGENGRHPPAAASAAHDREADGPHTDAGEPSKPELPEVQGSVRSPRRPTSLEALTLTQQRLAAAYGPHGLELLTAAEDHRQPDAAYRIGLLLLLDGNRHEGFAWLMQAEDDGRHPLATRLIEVGTRTDAVEQAVQLGDFSALADDLIAAAVYYRRAADHGHLEAAMKLSVTYDRLGDQANADHWYRRALKRQDTTFAPENRAPRHARPSTTEHGSPESTPPQGLPIQR